MAHKADAIAFSVWSQTVRALGLLAFPLTGSVLMGRARMLAVGRNVAFTLVNEPWDFNGLNTAEPNVLSGLLIAPGSLADS